MTLTDFKNKYLGKTLCYPDGQFCGECLSLCKIYIKECFGFNPPPSGSNSAYGYWLNFPSPLGLYFTKVENTPTGVPKPGDLVIWEPTPSNSFGHIAIFLEGTDKSFKSLDQNYGGKETHVQGHYYTNVKGWLTPIMSEKTYTEAEMSAMRLERDSNWNKYQSEKADHEATKSQLEEVRKELKQFIETLASKLTTIADKSEVVGAVERILTVEDQLSQANKKIASLEQDKLDLEADKNREISKLRAELEEIKKENEEQGKQIQQLKLEKDNQAIDIKRLSERLDELTELPKHSKPEISLLDSLKVVINFIRNLWQRK